jgi:hypothetical protein
MDINNTRSTAGTSRTNTASRTNTSAYRKSKKREKQRAQLLLLCIFAFLLFLAIVFGALFGNRSAVKSVERELESVSASQEAASSTTEPESTTEPSLYRPGNYIVDTDGSALNMRKNHSINSEPLTKIPNKTSVSIIEIFHDENASVGKGEIEYWGKCSYSGETGWVAMKYLKKDASAAPDDTTGSGSDNESTTVNGDTSTTASSTKYAPGRYSVETGGWGLSMRYEPNRESEAYDAVGDGEILNILEVVESQSSDPDYRYWGKIEYDGETLYVSMAYLEKVSE